MTENKRMNKEIEEAGHIDAEYIIRAESNVGKNKLLNESGYYRQLYELTYP